MSDDKVDIFVIGGGINGCGIARDAVGRGYSVFLAEMNDLASGTSSWSTKLIHGGLRYLEFYEFRLVREALMEREVLWAMAPHIIRPLRFILPHHKGLRPAWLLRLGLFLYDHLGGRKLLPPTKTVDLKNGSLGEPLNGDFAKGFEYSDCWVDDARLVVLNARDAAEKGATIATRTKVERLEELEDGWQVTIVDQNSGAKKSIEARLVVNAAGPWVDSILRGPLGKNDARNVRLVQGSHIVVPRLYDHDRCFIFQNSDGRIIFTIPYQGDFTLIGTTDQDYKGDPAEVAITSDEISYLCAAASEYFNTPVEKESVVWTYSGVRPLYDDGADAAHEATRDYVLKTFNGEKGAPLINIFGGKITTYRRLALSVLEKIETAIGAKGATWTERATLPGGGFVELEFDQELRKLQSAYPFLHDKVAYRLFHAYGLDAFKILGDAKSEEDLGRKFGGGLSEAEVRWLMQEEWARNPQDVLWRRSKLGLRLSQEQVDSLSAYIQAAS
ncbi:MAG: glycerol-3-phosphate dehydrogenase [Stappiaceae bacterium]